jgi:hypothetical protein
MRDTSEAEARLAPKARPKLIARGVQITGPITHQAGAYCSRLWDRLLEEPPESNLDRKLAVRRF